MSDSLRLPLLFAVIFGLCFWRVALSVVVALAAGWLVSIAAPLNTAYFSYAVAVMGLVAGVVWQVRAGRLKTKMLREGGQRPALPSLAVFFLFGVVIAAALEWAMASPVTVLMSSVVTALTIALVGQRKVHLTRPGLARGGAFFAGSACGLAVVAWFLV